MGKKYSYEELEQFAKKIQDVMTDARENGNYSSAFEQVFTDDAFYRWGLGPMLPDFMANGKDEILKVALGAEMSGTDGWKYPWLESYIDDEQGIICYRWYMESPWEKPDGSFYRSAGYGYTAHWYAGNMLSSRQEDWCESDPLNYTHAEGFANGMANEAMRQKVLLRRKREAMAIEQWQEHLEEIREEYGQA